MTETLGKPVYVGCFVCAYYGKNIITRRSHSGILLFVNKFLNKVLQQDPKHSQVEYVWIRANCYEDCKEHDCGNQNQVENGWDTLGWARKYIL